MRPFRLICTVAFFFVVTFFILLSLLQPIPSDSDSSRDRRSSYRSRWSFGAPASLFPPSAIISLTDDNTTFFLSRPALYGPVLPADGLTAQLWVGYGFGDDTLVRGGMVAVDQAELGCSDIPGWSEGRAQLPPPKLDATNPAGSTPGVHTQRQGTGSASESQKHMPEEDDDTDNFLHYPLRGGTVLKSHRQEIGDTSTEHADIQSLQESAEISGKVVLLSRGGCGFLEKTKWVQRRGGVALIVGDYTRGGHLIQMSASEDTSNVTIPSIFTAYTSAHLLSSLVPSRSTSEAIELEKGKKQQKKIFDRPTFTTSPSAPRATRISKPAPVEKTIVKTTATKDDKKSKAGWLSSAARKIGLYRRDADEKGSRRPPSSGTISWVQSQDWDDDKGKTADSKKAEQSSSKKTNSATSKGSVEDDFVIGVHDWRDPDMLSHSKEKQNEQQNQDKPKSKSIKDDKPSSGSRTPTSGVYDISKDTKSKASAKSDDKPTPDSGDHEEGWLHNILGAGKEEDTSTKDNKKAQDMYRSKIAPHFIQDQEFEDDQRKKSSEHEGLWITITPANVSASPLFDTLLVLVVSPLVTLSVVYALLLLRSRIRRRRWRAPRSVVDRLPVRTYHTMSCSSSTTSSQMSPPSSTTPLLPSAITRSRPRSATVSSIRQEASASLERATAHLSSSSREKSSPTNAFKRKYKGRQVECVVCLEEYIDGQSQVMSLPCGHEFHAECITPWLTTRRRTCPICKGDVVRSMDNGSNSSTPSSSSSYTSLVLLAEPTSPRTSTHSQHSQHSQPQDSASLSQRPAPITHASDPALQATIAQTRNDSPSSAIPIPSSSLTIGVGNEARDGTEDLAATLVGSGRTGDGIFVPPQRESRPGSSLISAGREQRRST